MKFIKRIRIWLQKPWFVGVLSVVAILFSARNIVLPLLDMSSPKPSQASSSSPIIAGQAAQPAAAALSSGAAPTGDLAAARQAQFGSGSYRRNPFLFADDPRQPGYRRPARTVVLASGVSQKVAIETGLLNSQMLFSLNAILEREGHKYALINRQVSAEGDSLQPNKALLGGGVLSAVDNRQLGELLALDYTLTKIDQSGVTITSGDGEFSLSLSY